MLEFESRIRINDGFEQAIKTINQSQRMESHGLKIDVSENANSVLTRRCFGFTAQDQTIRLVRVSLADLKLKGKPSRVEIYQQAHKFFLQECHIEAGPNLRLKYLDQPLDERLIIASEPLRGNGSQDLFVVDRDRKALWLRAIGAAENAVWDEEFEWIFQALD